MIEFIELVIALADGRGCFVELLAFLSSTTAVVSGATHARERRLRETDGPNPKERCHATFFWWSLAISLGLTSFVIAKYLLRSK